LAAFVLVMVAIPFAFGQGHIVMQVLNSISEVFGRGVTKLKKN